MTDSTNIEDSQGVNKAKGEVSSTPAKPSERIKGSSKNEKGSASSKSGNITFSEAVITSLKNKVKEHNAHSKSKVTLGILKAVHRRGAGAFSTSHRPNMTRQQWAMARVNSFLKRGHSQDNDLRKADEQDLLDEEILQDFLDAVNKSFEELEDIEKGNVSQVSRDSKGNLVYRGIKFAGYGKPRKSDNPKKDRMVLVRKGDQVKIVRYGDASMRQNYSVEANDRFYDRFGNRPEANDKFSATYWSLRDLWARGSMKGKGAKPLVPLKKSEDLGEEFNEMSDLDKSFEDDEYIAFEATDEQLESALTISKKYQEEEMIAIEPLYINSDETDAHEDGITDEQLDLMVANFNKSIDNIRGNIHHQVMCDGFKPIKAYRMPLDVYVGDPNDKDSLSLIRKGEPVVEVKFHDQDLWEKRKSGFLKGVSIGAKGKRVPNPNYIPSEDSE